MNKPVKHDPEQFAREFSVVLRSWLTPAQMEEVIARNKAETDPRICHSHDFCDANMAMNEVFLDKHGLDLNAEDEAHVTLWNEAWDIAKANDFFPHNHMSSPTSAHCPSPSPKAGKMSRGTTTLVRVSRAVTSASSWTTPTRTSAR
jgi:hypothetical protein